MSFVLFLLCPQPRLSSASVVFDFNASLNDSDPLFSMLLSVFLVKMEKRKMLMGAFCVLCHLYPPLRLSSMSVVFDFNASLIDVAPVSPILFPVDFKKK